MPAGLKHSINVSEKKDSLKKILEKKLKLDNKIVGLLVSSAGSIQTKLFFDRVTESMNRI